MATGEVVFKWRISPSENTLGLYIARVRSYQIVSTFSCLEL